VSRQYAFVGVVVPGVSLIWTLKTWNPAFRFRLLLEAFEPLICMSLSYNEQEAYVDDRSEKRHITVRMSISVSPAGDRRNKKRELLRLLRKSNLVPCT